MIIATVTICEQTGIDTFVDRRISRGYEETRSISDILTWAKATTGSQKTTICDIQFSEYTGASL